MMRERLAALRILIGGYALVYLVARMRRDLSGLEVRRLALRAGRCRADPPRAATAVARARDRDRDMHRARRHGVRRHITSSRRSRRSACCGR